jgi:hypothetical protein
MDSCLCTFVLFSAPVCQQDFVLLLEDMCQAPARLVVWPGGAGVRGPLPLPRTRLRGGNPRAETLVPHQARRQAPVPSKQDHSAVVPARLPDCDPGGTESTQILINLIWSV